MPEIKKEVKELNIFQRLLEITNELTAVAKNLKVGEGRFEYKAVGEADVLAAVKPLEHKWGVYSYPFEREIIVDKETQTKSGTTNQFIRNETIYRFVNVDKPADYIDIKAWGDGVDSGDKAPGKAMTYADKYALLKAYKIITGEDPDQKPSEPQETKKDNLKETKATESQLKRIQELYEPDVIMEKILPFYKVGAVNELTLEQASQVIKRGQQQA